MVIDTKNFTFRIGLKIQIHDDDEYDWRMVTGLLADR